MFDIGDNINTLSTLPTRDLDAAVSRYEKLGFATTRLTTQSGIRIAIAKRDGVELRLADNKGRAESNWVVLLVVTDAKLLYREWQAADVEGLLIDSTTLESADIEGGYIDPDGILFLFASEKRE